MPKTEKVFKKAVDTYYHGNQLAPHELRNLRLEPSVNISEAKGWHGDKNRWENWGEWDKKSKIHKGFFISKQKSHASYFATHWHGNKTGYLYTLEAKPHQLKRAMGVEDPEDNKFLTHPVVPKYVEDVKVLSKKGSAPSKYKESDFHYSNKRKFHEAVGKSSAYYYRQQQGKKTKVKKGKRRKARKITIGKSNFVFMSG